MLLTVTVEYHKDLSQDLYCFYPYVDDSCLVYQHRDVKAIDTKLTKIFSNNCNWFVDNKLSIHFGEEKTKCILFGTKKRVKKIAILTLDMVQYIISTDTQLHILVAYQRKTYQEKQSLCSSLRKSILDDFCIGKIDFCLNHFIDFSVT